jgi:hypothetical protein
LRACLTEVALNQVSLNEYQCLKDLPCNFVGESSNKISNLREIISRKNYELTNLRKAIRRKGYALENPFKNNLNLRNGVKRLSEDNTYLRQTTN